MNPRRRPSSSSIDRGKTAEQHSNIDPNLLAILQNYPVSSPLSPSLNPGFGVQQTSIHIPNFSINEFHPLPHARFSRNQPPSGHRRFDPMVRPCHQSAPTRGNIDLDGAVNRAWHELIAMRSSVSVQKVCDAVVKALKVDSWATFGVPLDQVPSLKRLMAMDGKVNTFIHCFVGVRPITTLHDLELELCKNRRIKKFEDLMLGPIYRHPLVLHYFAVDRDKTETYKITTEEVILLLSEYMDICNENPIDADDFLDFIASNRSIKKKGMLSVRIQCLGTYMGFIRQIKLSEKNKLNRCKDPILQKSALTSKIENELQERVLCIPKLEKPFRPETAKFCGKHTRFASSDSDEDINDNEEEHSSAKNESSKNKNSKSDHFSSCPYPSASEEISRLGLSGSVSPSVEGKPNKGKKSKRKKREVEVELCHDETHARKYMKGDGGERQVPPSIVKYSDLYDISFDYTLPLDSLNTFVESWKDACLEHSIDKVFDSMLQYYDVLGKCKYKKQRKIVRELSKTLPFIGLLNVAVESIKSGNGGSIFDAVQTVVGDKKQSQIPKLTAEDIASMINDCDQIYKAPKNDSEFIEENNILKFKRLRNCESWLVNHLGIKDFHCIGHGDFLTFLERHSSLLSTEAQKIFLGYVCERPPLEVSFVQQQVNLLLSQAITNTLIDDPVTQEKIIALVQMQFPTVCFKLAQNYSCVEAVKTIKENVGPKRVIFSASLVEVATNCNDAVEVLNKEKIVIQKADCFATSKDAVEVFRVAPFLVELKSWSNWEMAFAPSLGSMMGWLINSATDIDIYVMVTKDGSFIRIDELATVESFLESALRMSSFSTASDLLSLYSFAGGSKNMPLSLLKCYSGQAFDVALKKNSKNYDFSKKSCPSRSIYAISSSNYYGNNNADKDSGVVAACRFFLDVLNFLPSEFRVFAADILLGGMRPVIKNAPLAILSESNVKERFMLREIGMASGIVDWVNCCDLSNFTYEKVTKINDGTVISGLSADNITIEIAETCWQPDVVVADGASEISTVTLSGKEIKNLYNKTLPETLQVGKALIDSIRKNEFGLDSGLSPSETDILKKHHARLGRALYCLSQELYSQDSHFLLELVQNADDNEYPANVEPTMSFILKESGVIILNNEVGFSAENIKALCDVGNSTKQGSTSGYVGQKGIGFKSVFRITDAPEIHSNGFHFKFDITDGQIGFVLPTNIPPCDVESFNRLLLNASTLHGKSWKTCIVLPFNSKLSERTATEMFLDLHPSLLLFLHRLRCVIYRNIVDDTLTIMRKQSKGGGIVNVSCGDDTMTWLVASQHLPGNSFRPNVDKTEISIAFTLKQLEDGTYVPLVEQQPVFSFLPLRHYGFKFILQGDFILPSSREEVDKDNAWNQWLLTKFPSLFVSAEKLFCSLPCFSKFLGKAVTTYMSFVPVYGEVHGFFSGVPRAIISELQRTACLFVEGDNANMVPPCNVLRGWTEQARSLLPDKLLKDILGLGFMDRNITLSDSVARALGVDEYGAEILIKFISALSIKESGIQLMGFSWLSSWLSELYSLLPHSGQSDVIEKLKRIPFIPLSDGTYSSLEYGTVWIDTEDSTWISMFPKLSSKLRMVSPLLLTASAVDNYATDDKISILRKIGVQQLSAHDIMQHHVLSTLCDDKSINENEQSLAEYLCFVMIHLESSCPRCLVERRHIMSELLHKAFILTNRGLCRVLTSTIHFSKEFENPFDIYKLINAEDMEWLEVDDTYLKHPATQTLSNPIASWRAFFGDIGVTDFVKVFEKFEGPCENGSTNSTSVVIDWDSDELKHLLQILFHSGCREKSKYLLEVLDTLWDDNFSDKIHCFSGRVGDSLPLNSSFANLIINAKWVASSLDDDFHCPGDLFLECDEVSSVFGPLAPYAVPKVKSSKLANDIGMKTSITVSEATEILSKWGSSRSPFRASTSQFSKLYLYIWGQNAASQTSLLEGFFAAPFIFVPVSPCRSDKEELGVLLTPKEVCWCDPTGCLDLMVNAPNCEPDSLVKKAIHNVYPALHDFFVNTCGVRENPSFRSYLDILWQLSNCTSPSLAGYAVFQVLLKWANGLKSGALGSEHVIYLKNSITTTKYSILPTLRNEWVSRHPSRGLVCWCDDKNLLKLSKHIDDVHILSFKNLGEEQDIVKSDVLVILQKLEIPALSELVTREAIYRGICNRNSLISLINWALPFAQRYIINHHNVQYLKLKQSEFSDVSQLQVLVVSKLEYISKLQGKKISSKQTECACLLQENTLYAKPDCDSHTLFMELSRLFFTGKPDLHLANFIHLIKSMVETGCSEELLESFIVNSQRIPSLPPSEPSWILSHSPDPQVKCEPEPETPESSTMASTLHKTPTSDWPPVTYETPTNVSTALSDKLPSSFEVKLEEPTSPEASPFSITENSEAAFSRLNSQPDAERKAEEAMVAGRLGELVAFKYLAGKYGKERVKWVNEVTETFLPYDITVKNECNVKEYVEVKASRYSSKVWFTISIKEWQFAIEKGELFTVVHVLLGDNNSAKVSVFKNPASLCQSGKLQLAIVMKTKDSS